MTGFDYFVIANVEENAVMNRWLTQTEQPTLDEILDEPIIGLVMASDGVTRANIRAIIANLRGMRPDVGDQIIYRLRWPLPRDAAARPVEACRTWTRLR